MTNNTRASLMKAAAWTAAYILSIILANWMTVTFGLVPIGLGLAVTAGTFAAGAALVLRDAVQISGGRIVALVAMGVGVIMSYVVADPYIALASAIAFAGSEIVDFAIFTPLRKRSVARAVIVSSIVSAPIDTVLFLWIAGFGITWQAVVGQFIVKTIMAALAVAFITYRRR